MTLRPALVIAALLLTACSPSGSSSAAPTPTPTPSTTAPAPSQTTPTPPDPSPTLSGSAARIGGPAVKLAGGVEVTVGQAVRHPSGPVSGVTRVGDTLAIYPVAVTNTGSKPIDMTLTAVTAYANGEQADLFSDSEHPADNRFSGTLLPGKTMKATFGFLVRKGDAGNMQLEVYVGETGEARGVFVDNDGTT